MSYQTYRVSLFAFFFTFYLFGCGHRPPVIQEVEVKVPVAVACLSPEARAWLGDGPMVSDTNEAIHGAPTHEARVNLMIAGRVQRDWWIDRAIDQLEICASLPTPSEVTPEHATLP